MLYNVPHPYSLTISLICTAAQSTSSVQPHNLAYLYSHALYLIFTVNLPHQYSYKIHLICTTSTSNLPHLYSNTIYLIYTAIRSTSSVEPDNLPHSTVAQSSSYEQPHNLLSLYSHTIYLFCTQSTLSVQPHNLSHLFSHTIYLICSATQSISSVQLYNPPHLYNLFTSSVQPHNLPHLYSHTIFLICRATQSTFSVQPHNLPFLYTIILICSATQSTSSLQPHNLPHLFSHTIYLICSIRIKIRIRIFIVPMQVLPYNLPHLFSHTIYLICIKNKKLVYTLHNAAYSTYAVQSSQFTASLGMSPILPLEARVQVTAIGTKAHFIGLYIF